VFDFLYYYDNFRGGRHVHEDGGENKQQDGTPDDQRAAPGSACFSRGKK